MVTERAKKRPASWTDRTLGFPISPSHARRFHTESPRPATDSHRELTRLDRRRKSDVAINGSSNLYFGLLREKQGLQTMRPCRHAASRMLLIKKRLSSISR
jgi:hypothetical protein